MKVINEVAYTIACTQWIYQCKNFENRLAFGKVTYKSLVSWFSWFTVYILYRTALQLIYSVVVATLTVLPAGLFSIRLCLPVSSVWRKLATVSADSSIVTFHPVAVVSWLVHDAAFSLSPVSKNWLCPTPNHSLQNIVGQGLPTIGNSLTGNFRVSGGIGITC